MGHFRRFRLREPRYHLNPKAAKHQNIPASQPSSQRCPRDPSDYRDGKMNPHNPVAIKPAPQTVNQTRQKLRLLRRKSWLIPGDPFSRDARDVALVTARITVPTGIGRRVFTAGQLFQWRRTKSCAARWRQRTRAERSRLGGNVDEGGMTISDALTRSPLDHAKRLGCSTCGGGDEQR